MKKSKLMSVISILTAIVMLVSLSACGNQNTKSEQPSPTDANVITSDINEVEDAFVEFNINGITVNEIEVIEINVDEIVVDPLIVENIDVIETEVVSITDSMVMLAHQNFVSYYGDCFDFNEFIKDVAIGATVVVVCVTLSTVGGPVGTFFGVVITSEFTAATLAVGAAIDAAVSGYQAYQEGGDMEYIVGHMLNGVADGFKWGAILAPVTGGIASIKAFKAIDALKKLPAFKELDDKKALEIFRNLSKIIRKSAKLTNNYTDDAIRQLYKEFAEEAGEKAAKEITEDIFVEIVKHSDVVTKIARQFNPLGVASEIEDTIRNNFWDKGNINKETADEIIKQLKKGSLHSFDDITDTAVKEYIKNNSAEFVRLYGNSLSKEFMDAYLKNSLGDDAVKLLKKSITSKDAYCQLIKEIPKETLDSFLDDTANLLILQCRFGADNLQHLTSVKALYSSLLKKSFDCDTWIPKILDSKQIDSLGISDEQIMQIGNDIAEYYRMNNARLYHDFNLKFAEVRGDAVTDFIIDKNIQLRNVRYAGGIMIPAGENAEYIKLTYGEIQMSSQGFPVFDDYAIARVELDTLTGDSASDIAKANIEHHGTSEYNIEGYTWHHVEDGKTLILIPTELHDAYRHTGGNKLLKEGLKEFH